MENERTEENVWNYGDQSTLGADMTGAVDVTGWSVEALDGGIGKIDEATYEVGSSYIVVDTGVWIFGKKVMLPAGVVNRVDSENETVFVDRTKDQIKDAPEFDEDSYRDDAYRDEVGGYYGRPSSGRGDEPL
jgi:hypothetical protein